MQTGTIVQISPRSIMFIVSIDNSGDFAVFETTSSIEIAKGDRVRGDLYSVARQELLHLTQGVSFSACGQTGPCGLETCLRKIAAH